MAPEIYHSPRIFDGEIWHENAALIVQSGYVKAIAAQAEVPELGQKLTGTIAPGLIDLQVNGGGGVQFNNAPQELATIAKAHAQFGTTAILATLITDHPDLNVQALNAAYANPAILGLHFEGPHLAPSRKGTHDGALIRTMEPSDLAFYCRAASMIDHVICTIAPESVSLSQVRELTAAGVTVSLGHSDCSYETACSYFEAGASMVTHLFNAMSPLSHRAPGLVGAALEQDAIWAGLIADGHHIAPAALRLAIRAKQKLFLVSDAMCTIGSNLAAFTLNGREIVRAEGKLSLASDGTLAGADIALIDAVRYVHKSLGIPLDQALRLATTQPAKAISAKDRGHLRPGARADFFTFDQDLMPLSTWIGGQKITQM